MRKKERALFVQKTLEDLFPNPEIPLWHTDSYTLLIAVLLSAQCTDARVNQITPLLFAKAKTPHEMIQLSIEEIYQIIKPCGLGPRKASAIWNLSKQLIELHNAEVPRGFFELENLPGVGHKTASVVMTQAFGEAAFPVDTHIFRCARKWKLSTGKNVEAVEKDLKALFPKDTWRHIHIQMIYYARKYCPARSHKTENCLICKTLC